MKQLKSEFLKSFFLFFVLPFSLFFTFVYLVLYSTLSELSISKSVVDILFLELFGAFVLLVLLSYFFYSRFYKRVTFEIDTLEQYLFDISHKKEYTTPYKAHYYLDFLKISVTLKNIIKRVNNRDRKKK